MKEEQNKRVAGIDVSKAGLEVWVEAGCATIFQQRGGDRGASGMAGTPRSERGGVRAYRRVRAAWDKGCQRKG